MIRKQSIAYFVALCFFCMSPWVAAKVNVVEVTFDSVPHKIVQDTTQRVLEAVNSGLDPVKQPEVFISELSKILDPVIAFNFIARGVMGSYAKQASKEEVAQFAESFRVGLVNTYGKGISNFGDLEISVVSPKEAIGDKRRTVVIQEIRGANSTNQISYSMAKNKKGQWKMINVVLNGINLGQTFRGQFSAEVRKNKGDLAKTIKEWGQR